MAKSKSSRDRDVARIERQLAKAAKATPAAPAYIDIDDPADLVIADFYNALTTGNAAMVQSISRAITHLVHGTPIEMKRVPVFDLGHLTDTRNPTDDTIKEADWYRLDREAIALQEQGLLRLPYPECIFLFRFGDTGDRPPAIDVVCLTEVDGPIRSMIYTRQPDLPTPMDFWCAAAVNFRLEGSYIRREQHPITETIGADVQEDLFLDAASRASDSRVVMMLLAAKGPRIQLDTPPSERGPANPSAEPHEPPPVQIIKVLHLQVDRPGEPHEPRHTGIVQRPHWKRSYWATRKATGKSYFVPARAVHGGGGYGNIFKVERDTET